MQFCWTQTQNASTDQRIEVSQFSQGLNFKSLTVNTIVNQAMGPRA
ncbi:MAG: hypothetical protein LBB20_01515 [Puniceicoccales bacterium]|nr:hypothetical protein [Puniceicoccales bacterium]